MSDEKMEKDYSEFEDNISRKWLLWLGAITMAFGGVFLVKYSIEEGIIPPGLRVLIGTIFGFSLTVGGEKIRRMRKEIDWLKGKPDFLPSAISASGLFILFASIFSAYALYDLISSQVAYITLAIVSFGASYIAKYQGRFFAYIGLIGGMFIPAMVSTGTTAEWGLFPYLLMVTASSLWISRKTGWGDLAASALSLALIWVAVWVALNKFDYDLLPIGLYVLILGALSAVFLRGASQERTTDEALKGMIPRHAVSLISDIVTITCYGLLFSFIRLDNYSILSLALLGIAVFSQIIIGIKSAEYDIGGLAATITALLTVVTWNTHDFHNLTTSLNTEQQGQLIISAFSVSVVFAVSIFSNLQKLLRKSMWSVIGVSLPLINIIYVYWRVQHGDPSLAFAGTALGLALAFTFALLVVVKAKDKYNTRVLASYGAGAAMAFALALVFILDDAWLTFAFALEVVALGHIWKKLQIKELRLLALLLTGVVIVRLLLNPAIFYYGELHEMPIFNWLFYGYGLTALLMAYAARLFTENEVTDKLVMTLKMGSALLLIAFTTLEIHVVFSETGALLSDPTAFEAALQTVNWSLATAVLYWRESKDGVSIFTVLRKIMTALSIGGLLVGGGFMNNILTTSVDVGSYAILNLQILQYLIPGLLYGYKAQIARSMGKKSFWAYGTLAFFLVWYWISAEVRHAFHPFGSDLEISNWEWYSYSAAWLTYSLAILLSGMKTGSRLIRKIALALLAIVILKVFLFDMDQLEGIARALSFMCLGGTLIGMGHLYQRMLMRQ